MDFVTLAMAKAYTDQKAGYTETARKTITFDGDLTGKVAVPSNEDHYMVKVSDEVFTPDALITVTLTQSGVSTTQEKSAFEIAVDEVFNAWAALYGGIPMLQVFMTDFNFDGGSIPKGVYAFFKEDRGQKAYTSAVTYTAETIHPIDPKYLPGVCLPVVEITTMPDFETGASVLATEAESAALTRVAESGLPCILKFSFGMSAVAVYDVGSGEPMYSIAMGNALFSFSQTGENGIWQIFGTVG